MSRKVVQIAANQDGLFTLCDDGKIFHLYRGRWLLVAAIPQGDLPESQSEPGINEQAAE
jgi:hypothetical protein